MFKERYKEAYHEIETSKSLRNSTLEKMIQTAAKTESHEQESVVLEKKRVFTIRQVAYIATCVAMVAVIIFSFNLMPPLDDLKMISSQGGHNDVIWDGLYGNISNDFRKYLMNEDHVKIENSKEDKRKKQEDDKTTHKNTSKKQSGSIVKPMNPSEKKSTNEWGDCSKNYWEALRKFTYRSSAVVLTEKNGGKNKVYSPASTYTSLSLLANYTDGDTKEQILQAMMLTNPKLAQTEVKKAVDAFYFNNNFGKLKMENSIWVDGNNKYDETLLKKQAKNCYTSAYYEMFEEKEVNSKIQKWISDSTEGYMSEFDSSLDNKSSLALFNTSSFNDTWVTGFNKKETKTDVFYLGDKSTRKCNFMNGIISQSYLTTEYFRASSLPMKSGRRMILILPEEGYSTNDILSNPQLLKEAVEKSNTKKTKEVQYKIPLFHIQSQINLQNSLKSLGIRDAFDNQTADFTPLSEFPIYVSSIEQSACISIREKGERMAKSITNNQEDDSKSIFEEKVISEEDMDSEKSSVTESNEEENTIEEDTTDQMILNKPFVFILAKGNMPVMIGVIKDPSA